MKTSNKILISGLLAIIFSIIGYILYQKYSTPMVEVVSTSEPEWQTISTAEFKKVSVNRFNAEIVFAQKFKVELFADPEIVKHFTTEVTEGALKIKVANGRYEFKKAPKLRISCPTLSGLSVHSQTCDAVINSENLIINTSSSGTLNLKGTFNLLELESRSASNITLTGSAKIAKFEANSSSVINARNMLINNATVDCKSASQMILNVVKDLQAKASSAAIIQYYGNPKNSNFNATSAAVIKPMN